MEFLFNWFKFTCIESEKMRRRLIAPLENKGQLKKQISCLQLMCAVGGFVHAVPFL